MKKGSILCVILKEKRVQFFASDSKKKGFKSVSPIQKKIFNSLGRNEKIQIFESY